MAQWKVYRDEWTVVYASLARGEAGHQEARARVDDKYATWPEHRVRLQITSTVPQGDWPWYVMVQQPVLKAHFNDHSMAQKFSATIDGVVVLADSEQEDALLVVTQ
jgi:hypothetical protein